MIECAQNEDGRHGVVLSCLDGGAKQAANNPERCNMTPDEENRQSSKQCKDDEIEPEPLDWLEKMQTLVTQYHCRMGGMHGARTIAGECPLSCV